MAPGHTGSARANNGQQQREGEWRQRAGECAAAQTCTCAERAGDCAGWPWPRRQLDCPGCDGGVDGVSYVARPATQASCQHTVRRDALAVLLLRTMLQHVGGRGVHATLARPGVTCTLRARCGESSRARTVGRPSW
eukprot:2338835-Prymnesium_polylepis.1